LGFGFPLLDILDDLIVYVILVTLILVHAAVLMVGIIGFLSNVTGSGSARLPLLLVLLALVDNPISLPLFTKPRL
jgi:hypothetical protein